MSTLFACELITLYKSNDYPCEVITLYTRAMIICPSLRVHVHVHVCRWYAAALAVAG